MARLIPLTLLVTSLLVASISHARPGPRRSQQARKLAVKAALGKVAKAKGASVRRANGAVVVTLKHSRGHSEFEFIETGVKSIPVALRPETTRVVYKNRTVVESSTVGPGKMWIVGTFERTKAGTIETRVKMRGRLDFELGSVTYRPSTGLATVRKSDGSTSEVSVGKNLEAGPKLLDAVMRHLH